MLVGHWYLVQPGLSREPIKELVRLGAPALVLDVAVLLVPTGMVSVLDGSIDDGYQGLLGWIWLLSALSTLALLGVTWLALKERSYSAVMAAAGPLYLRLLPALGANLLPRALLPPQPAPNLLAGSKPISGTNLAPASTSPYHRM